MYVCVYCGYRSEYPLKDHKCAASARHGYSQETGEEKVERRIKEEEAEAGE
jgi:hypothetical protein